MLLPGGLVLCLVSQVSSPEALLVLPLPMGRVNLNLNPESPEQSWGRRWSRFPSKKLWQQWLSRQGSLMCVPTQLCIPLFKTGLIPQIYNSNTFFCLIREFFPCSDFRTYRAGWFIKKGYQNIHFNSLSLNSHLLRFNLIIVSNV